MARVAPEIRPLWGSVCHPDVPLIGVGPELGAAVYLTRGGFRPGRNARKDRLLPRALVVRGASLVDAAAGVDVRFGTIMRVVEPAAWLAWRRSERMLRGRGQQGFSGTLGSAKYRLDLTI